MRLAVGSILLAFLAIPADAKCIDVSPDNRLSLAGRLTFSVFPGPPNYESVDNGDMPEPTYILVLKRNICIEDGGQFADPTQMFNSVQVYTTHDSLWPKFKKLKGKQVTVSGSGFAAHTGHHHAPLVLEVTSIAAQ